jgi:hypothetical protein
MTRHCKNCEGISPETCMFNEGNSMTPEEINRAVAVEVMGWHMPNNPDAMSKTAEIWGFTYRDGKFLKGVPFKVVRLYDHSWAHWSPTTDIAAAYEMEAEVERRGLEAEYIATLVDLCQVDSGMNFWYDPTYTVAFKIAHATPAQRCEAALAAVRGK